MPESRSTFLPPTATNSHCSSHTSLPLTRVVFNVASMSLGPDTHSPPPPWAMLSKILEPDIFMRMILEGQLDHTATPPPLVAEEFPVRNLFEPHAAAYASAGEDDPEPEASGEPPEPAGGVFDDLARTIQRSVDREEVELLSSLRDEDLAAELTAWLRRVLPSPDEISKFEVSRASSLRSLHAVLKSCYTAHASVVTPSNVMDVIQHHEAALLVIGNNVGGTRSDSTWSWSSCDCLSTPPSPR